MSSDLERRQEAAAAAGGALLGAAVAGPLGGIVGAAAAPLLVPLAELVWDEWRSDAQAHAGRVVGVAAEARGVEPEQLVEEVLAAGEEGLLLAGLALAAAMRTVNEDKIRALGQALARGLSDDAVVDEELLIVKALEDIETPHLQVLQQMATTSYWQYGQPPARREGERAATWAPANIAKTVPGVARVLPTLLGALERHGLVEPVLILRDSTRAALRSIGGSSFGGAQDLQSSTSYRVTELGELLLQYLTDATADEQQPRPSED